MKPRRPATIAIETPRQGQQRDLFSLLERAPRAAPETPRAEDTDSSEAPAQPPAIGIPADREPTGASGALAPPSPGAASLPRPGSSAVWAPGASALDPVSSAPELSPASPQAPGTVFEHSDRPPLLRVAEPTVPPRAAPAFPRVEMRGTSTITRIDLEPSAPRPDRVVLTVSALTAQLKQTLTRNFQRVIVRGEVSNYRGPSAPGHLYFSLKDASATLEVRIWASLAQRLKFRLQEGMEVIAEGGIDLWEQKGKYSLLIQRIEPAGAGALAVAFAQLKERLTAEGLMGPQRLRHPRPLPLPPRRIGIVTSRTGAALQDFLRILHRRHPRLSVLLCDARVQGDGAAGEVVRALRRLAKTDVDVIVVARGGGSAEDLWTFNEESVARAIAASPVPVVTAVGHEVDFTIADFVADARAATPSAAAEMLAPVLDDLQTGLRTCATRLRRAMENRLVVRRHALLGQQRRLGDPRGRLAQRRMDLLGAADRLQGSWRDRMRAESLHLRQLRERLDRFRPEALLSARRQRLSILERRLAEGMRRRLSAEAARSQAARVSLVRASPARRVREEQHQLRGLAARLEPDLRTAARRARKRLFEDHARLAKALRGQLAVRRQRLHGHTEKLDALSPLKVMARGYALAYRARDGHLVRRADALALGDALRLRWAPPGCASPSECGEVDATVTAVRPAQGPGKLGDA